MGADVVAACVGEPPDCILLDYLLPDMDGLAVLDGLILADVRCAVVMLSAAGNEAVVAEAMKRGAHDYVSKRNVTPALLGTVVRNAVDRAKITAELDRDRADLVSEMQEARDAADSTARLMATVSHEIRTPLNGIVGLARLLGEADLAAQERDYANTLVGCAADLLTIVNDVLDFSKIDAGQVRIDHRAYDPVEVARQVIELFRPSIPGRALALLLDAAPGMPRNLVGDPVRLRQILSNLVGNAVKFTETGTIRIGLSTDQGSGVLMLRGSVTDTGSGIPHAVLDTIFDPYRQAELGARRSKSGTGLGLAICKRLCEIMGGGIVVRSEPGRGTTFEFHLKQIAVAQDDSLEKATKRAVEADSLGDLTCLPVLVVDDNAVNRLVARKTLIKLGLSVEVVSGGLAAVEAVRTGSYALVLMDCYMPGVDGLEATRRIRAEEADSQRVPIVAMTASVSHEQRQTCFEAGMDAFVAKPAPPGEFVEVLRRWLEPGHIDAA